MSIQNKPDYKIFASGAKSGEVETFPDILRGWGVTIDRTGEIPPMEWFNAIGKRADEWLLYLTQRGIPEWDASLDYPKSALVMFGDNFYVSKKASKGEQPNTTQAAWSTLSSVLGLGNYYTKSESDAKFQPKGDYATNAALSSGLSQKLNTSSVVQSTGSSTTQVMSQDAQTKLFMTYGALGWGGNRDNSISLSNTDMSNMLKSLSTVTQVYRNNQKTNYADSYAANAYFKCGDTWVNISASQRNEGVTISAGTSDVINIFKMLSTSDITQDSGSSTTQVMSQSAVTSLSFGIGQQWSNVTSQRSSGVLYTNSSKKPIAVTITQTSVQQTASIDVNVNGVDIINPSMVSGSGRNCATFIVPAGVAYKVTASGANIATWAELK